MTTSPSPDQPTSTLVVAWAIDFDLSTGAHLGYGTLVGPTGLVLLHPATADRMVADHPDRQLTARLQVADTTGRIQVIDGVVYLGEPYRGVEVTTAAVQPIGDVDAVPGRVYWQGMPVSDLAQLLRQDEDDEPASPPFGIPPVPGMGGTPGVWGPWCWIVPSCPGCR